VDTIERESISKESLIDITRRNECQQSHQVTQHSLSVYDETSAAGDVSCSVSIATSSVTSSTRGPYRSTYAQCQSPTQYDTSHDWKTQV